MAILLMFFYSLILIFRRPLFRLLNYGFAGQLKDKIRPLSLIKKHRLIKYTNPPHNELKQTGRACRLGRCVATQN